MRLFADHAAASVRLRTYQRAESQYRPLTYSLTQRIVFNVGDSPIRSAFNRLDFTTQASEFSTPGQVPEPGTIPLMGLGLMGLLAIARRKKV